MEHRSKHKGIQYKNDSGRQKRWFARIMINGKYNNIGYFLTEEEAIKAYEDFIEKNKESLTDRAKNITKYRTDFDRDENGLISRICTICGKIDKFKKAPQSEMCKSCGIKESFKSRPAVGFKSEINTEEIVNDYLNNNMSLKDLKSKYNLSTTCIKRRLIKKGIKIRDYSESQLSSPKRDETNEKISKSLKIIYDDIEKRKGMSARRQGISIEEWTHFITPENAQYYRSEEFQTWRKAIIKRDHKTCKLCGIKDKELHAHHIKPKSKFWELRTDINNGITLCRDCHFSLNGKEEQYEQFFLDILKNSV